MKAKHRQLYEKQVYRAYMSEAIKNLTENVAGGFGREGSKFMATRYTDIVYPPKEPTKTADEIIDGIKQKLEEYE